VKKAKDIPVEIFLPKSLPKAFVENTDKQVIYK